MSDAIHRLRVTGANGPIQEHRKGTKVGPRRKVQAQVYPLASDACREVLDCQMCDLGTEISGHTK